MSNSSGSNTTIQPYLPSCSVQLTLSDYQPVDSSTFQPDTLTYYADMWRIWLPGAVLGGLAIIAAVCFLVWLCTLCCRPHAYTYQLEWLANSPFYSSSRERKRRNNRGVSWLLLLATLAAVGLCTWGLVEAILATDGKVTQFWDIVGDGQQQLTTVLTTATVILNNLASILRASNVITNPTSPPAGAPTPGAPTAGPSANPINTSMFDGAVQLRASALGASAPATGLSGLSALLGAAAANGSSVASMGQTAVDVAQRLQAQLPGVIANGQSSVQRLQQDGVQRIENIRSDYQSLSMQMQDTWRYVIIAVFFGVLILLCILASSAIGTGRAPRFGYACTLLLWLQTAVLMLAGAGLLSSVHSVSGDACLYTETYLHSRLSDISNTTMRQRAVLGLEYYTGTQELSDQQLLQQVYGINASTWTGVLLTAQPLLRWLNSTEGQSVVDQLPVSSDDRALVLAVPSLVNSTFDGIARFLQQVQRDQWTGVYQDAKQLVCCDVRGAAYMLWIAWTAAGSACLVLAALLTFRGTRLLVWDV